MRSGGFVIGVTAAVAGVVTRGSIGCGRHAIGAAIAHATIHALAAFLAATLFSVIAQNGSWKRGTYL